MFQVDVPDTLTFIEITESFSYILIFIYVTNSIGSLPEVWDPILEQIAKHSDSKGREVLLRCKLQYDKLNTALLNNDSSSFVRIFSKYVTLTDQIIPLYHNVEYAKACDVIGNRNGIIMLNQELCSANESNSTFLQKTNDFLKSVANNLYHASLKYQPTPTGKC